MRFDVFGGFAPARPCQPTCKANLVNGHKSDLDKSFVTVTVISMANRQGPGPRAVGQNRPVSRRTNTLRPQAQRPYGTGPWREQC